MLEHRWRPGLLLRSLLPETNLTALSRIHAIEPAAAPSPGPGLLVTGRYVSRLAGNLVEVELEDGSSVSGTGNHPVWSKTRQGWIALEELRPGELLAGKDGPVAVAQVKRLPGSGRVYNLEIHGQHVYRVGPAGVLVHNAWCGHGSIRGKRPGWFLKNKPRNWRKLPADKGHGWKLVDENGIERLRYMYPNKEGRFVHQQTGYFRRRDQFGNFLDIDGNIVPLDHPLFNQLTHIPLTAVR